MIIIIDRFYTALFPALAGVNSLQLAVLFVCFLFVLSTPTVGAALHERLQDF